MKDAALGLFAVVLLSHVGRYRCTVSNLYNYCSEPGVEPVVGVREFFNPDQFDNDNVYALYDMHKERTLFARTVVDQSYLTNETVDCTGYVNGSELDMRDDDVIAMAIPYQLGGVCNRINVYALNGKCYTGLWDMFMGWVIKLFEDNTQLQYCVKLLYASDSRRPSIVESYVFSYPGNKYLYKITMDSPAEGECLLVDMY